MSSTLIKNACLVGLDRIERQRDVLIEQSKIVQIGRVGEFDGVDADDIIEADGKYLAPGFIDLHIHGVHHCQVDNGPDDLATMCELLPQYGVTGFLPTLIPKPKGEDAEFLNSLTAVQSKGAQILGFHMEGPFLTLSGSIPSEALGGADRDRVIALIEASKPYQTVFSISPEYDGIEDLISVMTQNNSPAFITHTGADVKQTQAAVEAGARHATHFYDVFPAPAEKEGGVRPCGTVEAILAEPRVSVDFILDGVHVEPIAVKMALQCKGPDRVCLITDANKGAGLSPGRYIGLGGVEIEFAYPGAPARMTEKERHPGALTGSGLTLDMAVRNAVKLLGVDIPQAVRMASANPAKVIGVEDHKGQIKVGFDADMVLLNESLEVRQSWVAGEYCFSR